MSADAPVMVLAGLFKTQNGTPAISPKALKVGHPCNMVMLQYLCETVRYYTLAVLE